MFWVGLIVGAILGGIIGVFVISLCVASKTDD
jgi:LPS O-antigen subunit length determinant protein (WzzB/FepE family)